MFKTNTQDVIDKMTEQTCNFHAKQIKKKSQKEKERRKKTFTRKSGGGNLSRFCHFPFYL